ncbi:hypothetical protein BIV57_08080 [Mangrovactinospora gilvigrisea]|uniref:Uncharacterized protein n=1 Tax=Mangrovactinospora gilvigrisea TaxID=1428644 RepID=A0A1J7C8X0_9ACTN|nr:hypothetical protein BIV57_08080 [Mangrovactinospora gilvigrisea]
MDDDATPAPATSSEPAEHDHVRDPLEGTVLTGEDQAERAALVSQDPDDHRDDSEVATSADDPAGKYTTKRAAKREFERLVRNTGKLSRDIALWVHRDGPALLGFKSAAEGVMAIKDVAKSQAYRDVYLAEVAEQLALAAGLFDDPDGVKRVLDLPGLTAKNAELIRPQLTMLTEEVQRQANRESAPTDTVVEEILPRVVKDFVQRKKNPAPVESENAETPQDGESERPPMDGEVSEEAVNPYLAYTGQPETTQDGETLGGDLPPELDLPGQRADGEDFDPCPHCGGSGRIPRATAHAPA